jgi:adenylylsulfate kinase
MAAFQRCLPALLPGLSLLQAGATGALAPAAARLQQQQQQRGFSTAYDVGQSTNIKWHESMVSTKDKEKIMDQRGCVLWFTGLSGSGKSTVACTLEHALAARGKVTALLDGDNIRHGLNSNVGFSAADRTENIRRIGEVSKLFADTGVITLVSFISPYRADRDRVRARLTPGQFIEVFMKVPIEVCEQRDPKGLYKKARAGQLKGFTGIDDPYEEPATPEVPLNCFTPDGKKKGPEEMAGELLKFLDANGYLKAPAN